MKKRATFVPRSNALIYPEHMESKLDLIVIAPALLNKICIDKFEMVPVTADENRRMFLVDQYEKFHTFVFSEEADKHG